MSNKINQSGLKPRSFFYLFYLVQISEKITPFVLYIFAMSNGFSSNANPSGGTKQKVEGKVINLTQHAATAEQVAAGVVEPADKARVQELLTFAGLPDMVELVGRAKALAAVASEAGVEFAMVGGAPYLMAPLEWALRRKGITPLYAFSVRESVEQAMPDGTVKKVAVFRHLGFTEAVKPAIYHLEDADAAMAADFGWPELVTPSLKGQDKIEASKPVPTGWDKIEA